MSDLFIYRHMNIYAALGRYLIVCKIFCKAEQNADRKLIIKKSALDITRGCYFRSRIKADNIADLYAESSRLIRR